MVETNVISQLLLFGITFLTSYFLTFKRFVAMLCIVDFIIHMIFKRLVMGEIDVTTIAVIFQLFLEALINRFLLKSLQDCRRCGTSLEKCG